ncbi:hypothetical protein XENOCAPTIV_018875 [Xenoophorus captivus]|uniref:Secreted protein n=1 Tax=Xenoophorus captivus TaxID=1517983 RepID=A0ABV0R9G9_9TELE
MGFKPTKVLFSVRFEFFFCAASFRISPYRKLLVLGLRTLFFLHEAPGLFAYQQYHLNNSNGHCSLRLYIINLQTTVMRRAEQSDSVHSSLYSSILLERL